MNKQELMASVVRECPAGVTRVRSFFCDNDLLREAVNAVPQLEMRAVLGDKFTGLEKLGMLVIHEMSKG